LRANSLSNVDIGNSIWIPNRDCFK
jgi:hypothetical protein